LKKSIEKYINNINDTITDNKPSLLKILEYFLLKNNDNNINPNDTIIHPINVFFNIVLFFVFEQGHNLLFSKSTIYLIIDPYIIRGIKL
tara:strand:+ start:240 stop:506 length:267 start_codon:yes stop_codon:yes gene_type:complete